jgi:Mg-chelatase subunit ChlD
MSSLGNDFLEISVLSKPSVRGDSIQNLEICVELNVKDMEIDKKMRLGVVLIIDRSGSMNGKPLKGAILSGKAVVEKMTPNDSLCVISFNDRIEVVVSLQPVISKDSMKQKLDEMVAEGGTNMMEALLAGIRTLSESSVNFSKKLVILMSDGVPNSSLGIEIIAGLERENGLDSLGGLIYFYRNYIDNCWVGS